MTGANGQLGQDLLPQLLDRGHEAVGSGSAPFWRGAEEQPYVRMDLTDSAQTAAVLARLRPEAVIHCAAWTAVDAAEAPENRSRVWAINAEGTERLARACGELGCKLLYLSTDYVFDGQGTEPWRPDGQEPRPLNEYGRSKLAGERAVLALAEKSFVVRISGLFGPHGRNFVKTMLRLGRERESVRVVDDQIGRPTYIRDLARLLADLIESEAYGIYHASNEGPYLSWAAFAGEIFRRAGLPARVIPVSTAEYGLSAAVRPLNSRLDTGKLTEKGFAPLPPWQDALERFLKEWRESDGTD